MSTATATSESVREYERKVKKLRAWSSPHGVSYCVRQKVEEEDFRPQDCTPYRYCQLTVETSRSHASAMIRELAELAIEVVGYLTMNVYSHVDDCHIHVAVSRPLEEGE